MDYEKARQHRMVRQRAKFHGSPDDPNYPHDGGGGGGTGVKGARRPSGDAARNTPFGKEMVRAMDKYDITAVDSKFTDGEVNYNVRGSMSVSDVRDMASKFGYRELTRNLGGARIAPGTMYAKTVAPYTDHTLHVKHSGGRVSTISSRVRTDIS
jgi:hypothetical protein